MKRKFSDRIFDWHVHVLAVLAFMAIAIMATRDNGQTSQSTSQPSDLGSIISGTGLSLQSLGSRVSALQAQAQQLTTDNGQLTSQNATLNAQLSTLNAQLSKTHNAAGAATTFNAASNLNGDSFEGAVFNAAQKYAVVATASLNGVSASSDSGGIDVRGSGCTIDGTITIGCGQNGLSGGLASNCIINGATSTGNNVKNFDAYNEGGGGKWSNCSGCTFNGCNFSNNFGCGLWLDVGCRNITVYGGTYSGASVAGANAGKQVSNIRVEISSGVNIVGVTSACAAGQNTAIEICDSDHVGISNCAIVGQIGIISDARSATNPVANITIAGNDIFGSVWFPSGIENLTFAGNRFHLASATSTAAYVDGKALTFSQFQAAYDRAAVLVVTK